MTSTFNPLADLLPEPMALVSTEGVILAANRAFLQAAGSPRQSMVGRTLTEGGLTGTDPWPDYLRRCAGTRTLVLGAATWRRGDGAEAVYRCEGTRFEPGSAASEATVLLRLVTQESSSSRFVALTQKIKELSAEISRRNRAELQLRQQRELLHITLSSIADAVIATDRGGRVTFMNEVAARLTGWEAAAASGRPIQDVFRIVTEDGEPAEDPMGKALARGRIAEVGTHVRLIARDGATRPIAENGAPIVDDSGRLHGTVLVFRDVTELRVAQDKAAAAREAAEAANQAKDDFLAMLGHELRNPLAPIHTALHVMRLRGDSSSLRERTIIERQVKHLTRLVDDLLDMSRIARGKVELIRQPVSVADVVTRAVELASPLIDQRQHTLDVVVPREGLVVEADPFRLAQAITNLLTNAAKFSPPGGRIEVRADGADGEARISVRDTGMGIAPDLLPRVFDQFVQERQPLDRSHGGLGLGLSIVHNLVALHGGTISAHSEGPGRGSEFVIRLPATTGLAAHSDQTAESNTAAAVSPPAGEVRVLVVDDNQDAADMLVAALSARGYVVRQALDGLAALQVCSEFTPHVALLDLGLPVIDGYELAARLRQLPMLESLGLCAVTGYGQDADRARSQAAGFHWHLVKPIDLDVLERVVDELSTRR